MATNRSISLPSTGAHYQGSAAVATCEVREVPQQVSDEELTAFVAAVCATPRGLWFGGSGAAGDPITIHWHTLGKSAKTFGVPVPEVPVPRRPKLRGHIVDGVLCNENGRPLNRAAGQ